MRLKDKRIILTGGARGIAKAVTMAYVAEGAIVAVFDILDELGQQTVAEANQKGPGKAYYFNCDISSKSAVDAAFEKAVETLGGLDVLANIAGVDRNTPTNEITNEEFDFIMNINVRGTMLTNQAAFNAMAQQGTGNIINFGSDTGLVGAPGQAIYGASKAAVMSWTRTIANEWGRAGIRCNSVIPAIATPMFEEYKANMGAEELAVFNETMKHTIPLGGQLGDPDKDLAPVMVFLASDDSRFVNGQILSVNGGLASVR